MYVINLRFNRIITIKYNIITYIQYYAIFLLIKTSQKNCTYKNHTFWFFNLHSVQYNSCVSISVANLSGHQISKPINLVSSTHMHFTTYHSIRAENLTTILSNLNCNVLYLYFDNITLCRSFFIISNRKKNLLLSSIITIHLLMNGNVFHAIDFR